MHDHSYHILIVEDDPLFASNIEMQVDQLGHTLVGVADRSDEALQLMANEQVDLVLMDVNIRGSYDGIELTRMIKEQYDVPVLFITANHDDLTFNRASRSNPAGFILKPFTDLQLKRAIQLALQSTPSSLSKDDDDRVKWENGELFVRKNQQIHRLSIHDILYLEADGRYCRIHTDEQMFLVRKPMKELLESMNSNDFQRSHRSYVVNMKKVTSVDLENDTLVLGRREVPLSQREKERLLERLNWI